MVRVYALAGKAHHGKSTVANAMEAMLSTRHGDSRVHRMSFAAALKNDIRQLGFPQEFIDSKPLWMRELMQKYGQARRAVDEFYWLNKVTSRIQEMARGLPFKETQYIIIDDVRFRNEVAGLRSLQHHSPDKIDVTLFRVERMDYSDDTPQDVSEVELDEFQDWDAQITARSGQVDYLCDAAREALKLFGGLT